MNTVPKDQLFVECTEGELLVDNFKNGTFQNTVGTAPMEDVSLRNVLLIGSLSLAGQLSLNVAEQVLNKVNEIRYEIMNDERSLANNEHYRQISAHIDSIKWGTEPPVSLDEAYDTICVLEALSQS